MRHSCKLQDLAHGKFLVNCVTLLHEERQLLNTIIEATLAEHLLLYQESLTLHACTLQALPS